MCVPPAVFFLPLLDLPLAIRSMGRGQKRGSRFPPSMADGAAYTTGGMLGGRVDVQLQIRVSAERLAAVFVPGFVDNGVALDAPAGVGVEAGIQLRGWAVAGQARNERQQDTGAGYTEPVELSNLVALTGFLHEHSLSPNCVLDSETYRQRNITALCPVVVRPFEGWAPGHSGTLEQRGQL